MTEPRPLSPIPARELVHLMSRYGTDLAREPGRVGGLLRDVCGEFRLEISLLVVAAETGVAEELMREVRLPAARLSQLSRRLEDERGLSPTNARWTVDAWATALTETGTEPAPATDGTPATLVPIPAPPPDQNTPVPPAAVPGPQIPPTPWVETPPPADAGRAAADASAKRRQVTMVAAIVVVVFGAGALGLWALNDGTHATSAATVYTPAPPASSGPTSSQGSLAPPAITLGMPRRVRISQSTSSPSSSSVTISWLPPRHGDRPDRYLVYRGHTLVRKTTQRRVTDGDVTWGTEYTYRVRASIGEHLSEAAVKPVVTDVPPTSTAWLSGTFSMTERVVGPIGGGNVGYTQTSGWSFSPRCTYPGPCSVVLHDTKFGWTTTLNRSGGTFSGTVTGSFNTDCYHRPTLSHLTISVQIASAGRSGSEWIGSRLSGTVHETFVDCGGSYDYSLSGS